MAGGELVFQYSARPAEGAALAGAGDCFVAQFGGDPRLGGPVRSSGNQTFFGASEERLPGLSLSFLGVRHLGAMRSHSGAGDAGTARAGARMFFMSERNMG